MNRFESVTGGTACHSSYLSSDGNLIAGYKQLKWFLAFLLIAFMSGCGSGSNSNGGRGAILGVPGLVSIAVTPATASIPIGAPQQFMATATFSDGSSSDVTTTSTWISATPAVATVVATTGVATGIASGTSVITATYGGQAATANLTVTGATLSTITVAPLTSTIAIGGTQTFVATGNYSDGTSANISSTVTWTSGNLAVATIVSTGVATGVSAGPAAITATLGGQSGLANLTVTTATLSSISVAPLAATVVIGGTQTFVATGNYSDGTSANISSTVLWASSDITLATVVSPGVATGVKAGSPTITATLSGKSGSATLTVSPAAAGPKGPATVNLGTASNYVILAKTGVSTTGVTSVVGNIGVSPAAASFITGFGLIADSSNVFSTSSLVTGKIYAADYAVPTPANMTTAISDMQTAFTDAAGRTSPDFTELGAGDISGKTLAAGLYKWGTGVLVTNAGVTLSGGSNDIWIFQIAGNLTVNNSATVTLSGGAQAKNIFWQVSGSATLGTAVNFSGNILSQTLISLNTGATMTGRALAQTAVTLNANTVTSP